LLAFGLSLLAIGVALAQSNVRLTPPNQVLTKVVCGTGVSSCVLKATSGNFFGVYAECSAACWVMVFNRTTAPSNGGTTAGIASGNMAECFDVAAGGSKSLTYPTYPVAFSVGVTVAISSTACDTLTLSTVGFVTGTVN
jgi:hypothetical protein